MVTATGCSSTWMALLLGLLMLMLFSGDLSQPGNSYYCGSEGCERIQIEASGPQMGSVVGDCYNAAYPKYAGEMITS